MGIVLRKYLDIPIVITCRKCQTHLADPDDVISREFQGQHGRAILINVDVGPSEVKNMTTGVHEVADLTCVMCGTRLGWKYIKAFEPSQRYKVGHCILEQALVMETRQSQFERASHADEDENSSGNNGRSPSITPNTGIAPSTLT